MFSISKLKEAEANSRQKKKIDFELPYFMTFVTLLASSGFGPYTIFQKMREISLLPTSKNESEKILKRIDLLGMDPLTAIRKVKEKSPSKEFAEFLGGYISSIEGGGDVVSYLKSKMNSIFDRYAELEKQSGEKVKAAIEAYMTLQIVFLAAYIILASTGSTASESVVQNELDVASIFFIFPPIVSILFIVLANSMHKSKLKELDIKKILVFGIPGIGVSLVLIFLDFIPEYDVFILAAALIVASIWPMINFKKRYSLAIDGESASSSILRDIAETRKAGIGPEKCVIKACKRKDFGAFNSLANSISSRLEWGSSLNDIYNSLKNEIESFQVLISFKILFEIISSGGGNVQTLESLAGTTERILNIEKEKRDLLKPYVMIGFLLLGLTGFITLMVIDSLSSINLEAEVDEQKMKMIDEKRDADFRAFSFSVILQAWLAGLFLGKITTGSYSGGFQISAILVIIAVMGIIAIQAQLFDVGKIIGSAGLI